MAEQDDVIAFLSDPATHGGAEVNTVETHGAFVFLAGDNALKVKRDVAYDYMDFSTLESRETMLRRELDLNRPAAPEIYRDVVPVTRDGDGLALNGDGEPVEWVLRMSRFDTEDELSRVAERGELSDDLADALGSVVAGYHRDAPRRDADGATLIAEIVDELATAFDRMRHELGSDEVDVFIARLRAEHATQAALLTRRGEAGRVRRCHGDLHLRNLVLIEGRPVPFDALEFDETLGTCDVLYDLAFLLMDLRHRGLGAQANRTLNAWLRESDEADDAGLAALPLFLAVRAAIRAMVDVQTDAAAGHEGQSTDDARAYLAEAIGDLAPRAPRLVAVGGLSGTGKTTVARGLAPHVGAGVGAVHLRSDVERKRLAGVDPLTRLSPDAYDSASAAQVYDRLSGRAAALLAAGQSVVIDATCLDPGERDALRRLAEGAEVPFTGLWLEADAEVLARRVSDRHGDASDADAEVVAKQAERDIGPLDWERVDAGGPPETVIAAARARLPFDQDLGGSS
ncbi:hypothetical protein SAMN04490244_105332 [Tranquillimonas rosea]|uniref:Aminoglycoside phosphotransferase domain-containing protein n=1 Tax=Tranquillimonas rosea TaxID=641238 RepID=A0A1H9UJN5_9RHOB|nr:hypothetical protein SAMN04490244_105332 [Tranquillimonas rosea]